MSVWSRQTFAHGQFHAFNGNAFCAAFLSAPVLLQMWDPLSYRCPLKLALLAQKGAGPSLAAAHIRHLCVHGTCSCLVRFRSSVGI